MKEKIQKTKTKMARRHWKQNKVNRLSFSGYLESLSKELTEFRSGNEIL